MLQIVFDVATISLLLCVSAVSLTFHRRIARLRDAIAEAGEILPKLDEAVARMNETAAGFAGRVKVEMQAVETRVTSARKLATELMNTSRDAEDLMARLDKQLRQVRRQGAAREQAVPRELAEPKGFAERMQKMASGGVDVSGVASVTVREERERPAGTPRPRPSLLSTDGFNSFFPASA